MLLMFGMRVRSEKADCWTWRYTMRDLLKYMHLDQIGSNRPLCIVTRLTATWRYLSLNNSFQGAMDRIIRRQTFNRHVLIWPYAGFRSYVRRWNSPNPNHAPFPWYVNRIQHVVEPETSSSSSLSVISQVISNQYCHSQPRDSQQECHGKEGMSWSYIHVASNIVIAVFLCLIRSRQPSTRVDAITGWSLWSHAPWQMSTRKQFWGKSESRYDRWPAGFHFGHVEYHSKSNTGLMPVSTGNTRYWSSECLNWSLAFGWMAWVAWKPK